jgi:hypothetical protein
MNDYDDDYEHERPHLVWRLLAGGAVIAVAWAVILFAYFAIGSALSH